MPAPLVAGAAAKAAPEILDRGASIGGGAIDSSLGLGQAAYGAYQLRKANKLAKKNIRPEYNIPGQIKNQLTTAEQLSLGGLPEEQRQQYLDNIARSASFGASNLNDRKSGIAGTATLAQSQNDAYRNLLSADAAQRLQNISGLQNVRSNYAEYQDKEFDLNKFQPYQERAAAIRALKASGLQNVGSGIDKSAQGAKAMLGGKSKGGGQGSPSSSFSSPESSQGNGGLLNYDDSSFKKDLTKNYKYDSGYFKNASIKNPGLGI